MRLRRSGSVAGGERGDTHPRGAGCARRISQATGRLGRPHSNQGELMPVSSLIFKPKEFKKSSLSAQGPDCVEVAMRHDTIGVRDSKDPASAVLAFTPSEWAAFIGASRPASSTSSERRFRVRSPRHCGAETGGARHEVFDVLLVARAASGSQRANRSAAANASSRRSASSAH